MFFVKNTTLVINQFYLPGVFLHLKDRTVNASIWTIFVEVECYLVLLLGAYHVATRKWLYLSCFILFETLRVYMTLINDIQVRGLDLQADFTLGTYFFLGSLLYRFKDDISFKWFYANILLAIALVTVYTVVEPITLSIFFAYCFIIIGTSKSIVNLKGFDLSYGIYLYAFPVQQMVVSYAGYSINPWLYVAISGFFAATLALLSWTFIEKPFLRKKNALFVSKFNHKGI